MSTKTEPSRNMCMWYIMKNQKFSYSSQRQPVVSIRAVHKLLINVFKKLLQVSHKGAQKLLQNSKVVWKSKSCSEAAVLYFGVKS